jgi:hypothetical protein
MYVGALYHAPHPATKVGHMWRQVHPYLARASYVLFSCTLSVRCVRVLAGTTAAYLAVIKRHTAIHDLLQFAQEQVP